MSLVMRKGVLVRDIRCASRHVNSNTIEPDYMTPQPNLISLIYKCRNKYSALANGEGPDAYPGSLESSLFNHTISTLLPWTISPI